MASVARDADGATQCPKDMTFVAAGERVPNAFCVDNEATQRVHGEYPTWHEACYFCEAAGKFLVSYEQQRLAAKSTSSDVVRNSHNLEWVLNSHENDRRGQVGGFFYYDYGRRHDVENLGRYGPGNRGDILAFRCGYSPSPQ